MEKDISKVEIKSIKAYKSMLNSEMFDLGNQLNISDDNNAVIECDVLDLDNIFSKFDTEKDGTFSRDFNDYLTDETLIIPPQYNLELKMHVYEDFGEEAEKGLRRTLKRNYSYNITSDQLKIRRINLLSIIMYSFGLLSLLLTIFTKPLSTTIPIYETLLIITWYCAWEGTNLAFFERNKVRRHRFNMLRLYTSKVTIIRDIKR